MSVLTTKSPASLVGALYYNCIVVIVMSTIFVGTAISGVTDEKDSIQEGVFLVLSSVPSVILAFIGMGMMKNGVTPGDNQPLAFGVLSLILAICEGFMAAVCLSGLIQKMYAAIAALQFSSTILATMLWQSLGKPKDPSHFERV